MSGFTYICIYCRGISIASISKEFKRMEMNLKALKTKLLSFQKSSPEMIKKLRSGDSYLLGLSVKGSAKCVDELTVPISKKILTKTNVCFYFTLDPSVYCSAGYEPY